MERISKNVKISEKHHDKLKTHCDKNGLKIYRVIEKWIDANITVIPKKRDIYDEE